MIGRIPSDFPATCTRYYKGAAAETITVQDLQGWLMLWGCGFVADLKVPCGARPAEV